MIGKAKTPVVNTVNETATNMSTVVGADAEFEGVLVTKQTARIDGILKGEIRAEGTLFIGNTGKVIGNIHAAEVVVAGIVEGDIYATTKIDVYSTGKIYGDITTKALVVDEDGVFDGKCTMKKEKEQPKKAVSENKEMKQEKKENTSFLPE